MARALKDLSEGRGSIKYADNFTSTVSQNTNQVRSVAYLLQMDCFLQAEETNVAGAVESWQCLMNAFRSIGDEPIFTSQIVREAGRGTAVFTLERLLAQAELTDAQLQELQSRLRAEALDDILLWAIRAERAGWDSLFENWRAGKVSFATKEHSTWERWREDTRLIPSKTRIQLTQLQAMTQLVEVCKLPTDQQTAGMRKLLTSLDDLGAMPSPLIVPISPILFWAESFRRSQAHLRSADLALAGERYRLQHKRWPTAPAELVETGMLKEIPRDPFNGAPLRWLARKDGVIIYSVGPNGADDGGAIDRKDPRKSLDVGFQLWDPAARRQAPARALDEKR